MPVDPLFYQKFGPKDVSQVFTTQEKLEVNLQGDLETVAQNNLVIQRIIRRLLTNPGDLLAHPEYGAGLRRYIGEILTTDKFDEIKSNIISQMFLEYAVSHNPAPVVVITPYVNKNAINADITYHEKNTGVPYSFSLQISN